MVELWTRLLNQINNMNLNLKVSCMSCKEFGAESDPTIRETACYLH